MRYRPADVTGGACFFTVNLAERKRTLLVNHVDILRTVIQKVKATHPFHIDAMVILPDHLHALWTLPEGDRDFARHADYIHYNPVKHGCLKRVGVRGQVLDRARIQQER